MSLFDNLDDEEVLEKQSYNHDIKVTKQEVLLFVAKQANIYNQFKGFPENHPSTRKLRRHGAIYQYILENLK